MDRRHFISGAGSGMLAFQVGGVDMLLSPRDARAQGAAVRVLSPQEVLTVDALGDVLVPGAAAAGLTHYLDQQLAATAAESLLMIRYLDVPPPYAEFYKTCLASLAATSHRLYGKPFHELDVTARSALVGLLQTGNPENWQGPAAAFFYFVLRADAIDVVYGTPEGFAKLGIPYMPHIMPPTAW